MIIIIIIIKIIKTIMAIIITIKINAFEQQP